MDRLGHGRGPWVAMVIAALMLPPIAASATPPDRAAGGYQQRAKQRKPTAHKPGKGWASRTLNKLRLRPRATKKPVSLKKPVKKQSVNTSDPVTVTAAAPAAAVGAGAKPKTTSGNKRVGLREAWHSAREELQVYRGAALERFSDKMAVGRSDFNPKRSVGQNLESLVKQQNIPHYFKEINGRKVLHVVVDLAQGKTTQKAMRAVMRRVGDQTIELNYKAASAKNRWGHVAVRVGGGAMYDLTGTQGVARLPKLAESALKLLRGSGNLKFARRRSLRRFMESRRDGPHAGASVYYGMLFQATPKDISAVKATYNRRLGEVKEFNVSGGDGQKGIFSCAQYLTEDVPFLNERGIGRNVGAKSTASAARNSNKLEAVVVYKMPKVSQDQLSNFP